MAHGPLTSQFGTYSGAAASWSAPVLWRFGTADDLRQTDHAKPAEGPVEQCQWTGALQHLAAFACVLLALLLLPARLPAATRSVTSLADSGPGSLRNAIAFADSRDLILFAPVVVKAGRIRLTSVELLINKPLSIVGPGAAQLAISGNNNSRVLSGPTWCS